MIKHQTGDLRTLQRHWKLIIHLIFFDWWSKFLINYLRSYHFIILITCLEFIRIILGQPIKQDTKSLPKAIFLNQSMTDFILWKRDLQFNYNMKQLLLWKH